MMTKIKYITNEVESMLTLMTSTVEEQSVLIKQHLHEIDYIEKNSRKSEYRSLDDIKMVFGSFDYTEMSGGKIKINGNWTNENIKLLQVGYHKLWLHKLIHPQTAGALAEIISIGLDDKLNFHNGGGWVARHINWNPDKPLSKHAYGVAFDFSPQIYPYGENIKLHPEVSRILEKWGFYLGQNFTTPDTMHVEFSTFPI